jgi:glycosyltransferase involved in cell wall biosynthesis
VTLGRVPRRSLLIVPFSVRGAAEDYASILHDGLGQHGWRATILTVQAEDSLPGDPGLSARDEVRVIPASVMNNPIRLARFLHRWDPPEVIHVNQDFLPGMAAATLVPNSRSVVTVHTPALDIRYSLRGRALRRWVAPRVDAWIVLSRRNARLLSNRMPILAKRVHVVAPGLPQRRFTTDSKRDARALLHASPDAFLVGTVGRIAAQKRHDVLIRAAALASRDVPNLKVVIVGDGELRHRMERLADGTIPGRVSFTGHRADVPSILPAFDLFCLSSDFEGLPFAVLEAMAMGRPIVATDVQGTGEAVRDGVEGILVPPADEARLADAIVRLARDPGLAERLGANARNRFLEEFEAEKMCERTAVLYDTLIRERPRRGRRRSSA